MTSNTDNTKPWDGHTQALNRLVRLAQRGVQYAEGVERDTNYDSPLFGKSTAEEMEEEIEDLHEPIADLFTLLSGKRGHASDCAISSAPAYMPAPCNCDAADDTHVNNLPALEAENKALREALSGALKLLRQLERLHDDIIITGDIEHFGQALTKSEKSE